MSLLSVFTLSRLSTDLTYDLGRTAEVPQDSTVKCAVSRGKLMVLVESPHADSVPPSYVFAQVETLVRHRLEIEGLPQEAQSLGLMGQPVPIKVYLRQQGVDRPRAVHRFNWLIKDSAGSGMLAAAAAEAGAGEPQAGGLGMAEASLLNDQLDGPGADTDGTEQIFGEAAGDGDIDHDEDTDWEEAPLFSRTSSRIAAAAAALLAVGMVYGITRPCVVGSCDRIAKAQALGEAALIELGDSPDPQTVLDMRDQLALAVKTLQPIPPWSRYRREAQGLLISYRDEVTLLDAVTAAQEEATEASAAAQNPPHPISHWQTVTAIWQQAIDRLEAIPAGSPVHSQFVVPKLSEYRRNLAAIETRIAAERAAEASLNQAGLTAATANQQADAADSLADWNAALEAWRSAVSQLEKIPQGTLPHGDAQQLLPQYKADLAKVRTRYQQEQVAEQFYTEALRHAAAARQHEADNQWTLALVSWRDAVTQIYGVPPKSFRYDESRQLLDTYETSLEQAQENLRLALRFQKAADSFERICNSAFCQAGMQGGSVRLTLDESYASLAELSITPPNSRASVAASDQMIVQVNQLLQEVINIGKRTQLPIELYGASGRFVARFDPELEGYVKN